MDERKNGSGGRENPRARIGTVRHNRAKPRRPSTPFVSWRAGSSHSGFPCGPPSAATTAAAPCSLIQPMRVTTSAGQSTASMGPLYRSSSTPNRKLHTLWLMPAPGRCQSVDDWTIVSLVLAGSRGSAVNCRPTAADYYQQLVPSWNRKSSKCRLHAFSSPVHR